MRQVHERILRYPRMPFDERSHLTGRCQSIKTVHGSDLSKLTVIQNRVSITDVLSYTHLPDLLYSLVMSMTDSQCSHRNATQE